MYLRAIRQASIARSKHSPGVAGATIGIGESELRPNMSWSRSACSFFVGMPGRGAGALDVDDDQRQLDHDREAHRLGLERDARDPTTR